MTALVPPSRRSFAKLSVLIAICTFVVTAVLMTISSQIPKHSPWHDAMSTVGVIESLVLAPLAQIAGFVLAIIALFRSGERRGLACVGIILNAGVIVLGGLLVFMAFSSLAPR
jgi:hypothetical protein